MDRLFLSHTRTLSLPHALFRPLAPSCTLPNTQKPVHAVGKHNDNGAQMDSLLPHALSLPFSLSLSHSPTHTQKRVHAVGERHDNGAQVDSLSQHR